MSGRKFVFVVTVDGEPFSAYDDRDTANFFLKPGEASGTVKVQLQNDASLDLEIPRNLWAAEIGLGSLPWEVVVQPSNSATITHERIMFSEYIPHQDGWDVKEDEAELLVVQVLALDEMAAQQLAAEFVDELREAGQFDEPEPEPEERTRNWGRFWPFSQWTRSES